MWVVDVDVPITGGGLVTAVAMPMQCGAHKVDTPNLCKGKHGVQSQSQVQESRGGEGDMLGVNRLSGCRRI